MGKSGGVNKGQKVVENRGYSTIATEVVPWCPCIKHHTVSHPPGGRAAAQLSHYFRHFSKSSMGLDAKGSADRPCTNPCKLCK